MSLQQRFKQKPSLPAPVAGPRLLTLREAAAYINHSVDLVRRMVDERTVPHIVKGEGTKRVHVLIDRMDLDRFIDKKKVGVVTA